MKAHLKNKLITVFVILLIAYISSYVAISRISYHYNKIQGVDAFLYFPFPTSAFQSSTISRCNTVGFFVFYPLYIIDHNILGGPTWMEPMWSIEAPKKTNK